jgi:hypothetical protein
LGQAFARPNILCSLNMRHASARISPAHRLQNDPARTDSVARQLRLSSCKAMRLSFMLALSGAQLYLLISRRIRQAL